MEESRLPAGGRNLFQEIKAQRAAAEVRGVRIINLSIGQPSGPAHLSARAAAAEAVMSEQQSVHEYQDNSTWFACPFIKAHMPSADFLDGRELRYLDIPGIKPMLGVVILACGLRDSDLVVGMTNPGYPTPRDVSRYLKVAYEEPLLCALNSFRIYNQDLTSQTELVMVNFPHNPTGQIATRDYWDELCGYCASHNIRLFNDAAYAALVDDSDACTLTEVAVNFPGLSWAEAFSASKLSNLTGWRIGGMVGSPDFIGDIAAIKGNIDSGFAAPLATGVLELVTNNWGVIEDVAATYHQRRQVLCALLSRGGMTLAVEPRAGFFTFWEVPKTAFGVEIQSADHFNTLMIEKTGVVGVPFDPYIRYAVTAPIEEMQVAIYRAFSKARINK